LQLIREKSYGCYPYLAMVIDIEGIFKELWQNHHDPVHATYGIVGVIVLFVIYNRLLNKYQ